MSARQATYLRALAASGAVCAAALLWIARGWGGAFATLVFTNVLHLVAPLVAALLAWRRAGDAEPVEARGWRWLALACWSWAVGQAAWMLHEFWFQRGLPLGERVLPFPVASDAGFLLFFPFAALALLHLTRGLFRPRSRLRLAQDASLVALSLGLLAWVMFLRRQTAAAMAEDPLAMTVLLAYPIGDLLVVVLAVLLAAYAAPAERLRLRLAMLAAVVLAVGDAAFFMLAQPGTPYLSVTDVAWPAAFLLLGLAALAPDTPLHAPAWLLAGPRVAATTALLALAAAGVGLAQAWDPFTAVLASIVLALLAWRWVHLAAETRRARRIATELARA